WEWRHVRAYTARKTGRPIQILREMGHESPTGIADDLSSCCTDAELRLGEPDRRNRKRQVCGLHSGFCKSHSGRDRNGTSQVCNERWRDCTKRSGFWPRVAHTFRAASFRTWRSRRLALKFERVHHSRGTQRYGDGEMVTSLARSVTNDHFETER